MQMNADPVTALSPNHSASQEETLAEIEILLKHLSSTRQNAWMGVR